MANPWSTALTNLRDRLDEDLLATLYRSAGLPTAEIRAELAAAGLVWADPGRGADPTLEELEAVQERIITVAVREATLRAGVGAALGLLALPPEMSVALVQSLRLAQRLAVLYGHDPETDAGALMVAKALAAGLQLELAPQGQLGMRILEVHAMVRPTEAARRTLMEAVAIRAMVSFGKRVLYYVPGIGAGLSALDTHRSFRLRALRMAAVLARSSGAPQLIAGPVEEAEELPAVGGHTAVPR